MGRSNPKYPNKRSIVSVNKTLDRAHEQKISMPNKPETDLFDPFNAC